METLKRKVGRPRKNELQNLINNFEGQELVDKMIKGNVIRNLEKDILSLKEKIKEFENKYYQSETSFNSRVDKIKDNMFKDYMMRRKIYEEEVERLTKKIIKKDVRKYVEGQVVVKKHWNNENIFVLITKVIDGDSNNYYHDYGGFKYFIIGVSGVGTKLNNHWFSDKEEMLRLCVIHETLLNFVRSMVLRNRS